SKTASGRRPDPQRLELQRMMNHQVGAGNQTHGLCVRNKRFKPLSQLTLSPKSTLKPKELLDSLSSSTSLRGSRNKRRSRLDREAPGTD
ncbi:mCG145539, partial [Mus musculus]